MWRISERRYKQMKERCEIVTITTLSIVCGVVVAIRRLRRTPCTRSLMVNK